MAKGKSSRSRKRTAARGPLIQLSGAARLQLGGAMLLMLSLVTLLSLLSLSHGRLTAAWLRLLAQAFGWGRLVIPFGLGVAGILVFMAGAGHTVALPWRRVIGLVLLFVSAEGLIHSIGYAPGSESLDAARRGVGAGLMGYGIQHLLWLAVGDLGGVLVLIATLVGAVLLIVNRRPADLVALAGGIWNRATAWYRLRRVPVGGGLPAPAREPTGRVLERVSEPVLRPRPAPASAPAAPTPAAGTEPKADAQPRMVGAVQDWRLPPIEEILEPGAEQELSEAEIRAKVRIIEETLQSFGVPARVVEVNQGPAVTQFGVEPGYVERRDQNGRLRRFKVKVSKIESLANDLALALAATSLRIEAPVPGRPMLGIEIPNARMANVTLRSVMESEAFRRVSSRLRLALGLDVSGQPVVADLATMPHLLIAGATGSGKSVCINAIIACLLCNNTPDDLRLILIDPKRVELTGFNGVPHLLTPVVVDIDRVVGTLKWVTREMDRRYGIFAQVGVRNIEGYNASAPNRGDPLFPYIVVIIDELADLMMVAPDEVERSICRIAQMARATGIHLIIATQRPSVDVVTGLIKANFPARISFAVSTQVDSRVILDAPGAEQLLGRGDMLFMPPDAAKLVRVQGSYVSEGELSRLVNYWKGLNSSLATGDLQGAPDSLLVQKPLWQEIAEEEDEDDGDPLLDEAIAVVRAQNRASVSLLQRKLRIGYARAARLMDLLEEQGIVGPPEGPNHSRPVLAFDEEEEPEEEYDYEEHGQ